MSSTSKTETSLGFWVIAGVFLCMFLMGQILKPILIVAWLGLGLPWIYSQYICKTYEEFWDRALLLFFALGAGWFVIELLI